MRPDWFFHRGPQTTAASSAAMRGSRPSPPRRLCRTSTIRPPISPNADDRGQCLAGTAARPRARHGRCARRLPVGFSAPSPPVGVAGSEASEVSNAFASPKLRTLMIPSRVILMFDGLRLMTPFSLAASKRPGNLLRKRDGVGNRNRSAEDLFRQRRPRPG